MPGPAPSPAPPNFYDNLPSGGAGVTPAAGGGKEQESDTAGEILQALSGCYRVMKKIEKLDDSLKGGVAKIKDDIKTLVVQGLKKDPSELDSGDTDSSAPPAAAASPKSTDETHAA